jgi:hypothetical protein
MLKKLLGAAAIAAVSFGVVPAQAAKVGAGCTGANLAKAESTSETMGDGPNKFEAQKEIAAAQEAMLADKWGVCSMHLSKAMHAEGTK